MVLLSGERDRCELRRAPLSTTWTTTPSPRTQIEQGLLDVFTQKTNAVLTNVVGPNEPIYLAGSKIAGVVPWVPAAGTIGMGINIFSYDGGVSVSLQVDPGLIPDPDTIIADYEREVEALRKLAPRRRNRTAARQ